MQGQHTCSICLEELPGAAFVWPGGCDHASCRNCVRQLCNLHVAEGGLENLRCPDPKCKEPFDRQVQLIVVLWCHIMSVLISGTDCVLSARGSCSAIRRRALPGCTV